MSQFVKICELSDIPDGELYHTVINDSRIVLANINGTGHASCGVCTHDDAELGMLNDDRIVCPVHLSQFDIKSGEALNLPATDPLLIFEVKIDDSSVLIKI